MYVCSLSVLWLVSMIRGITCHSRLRLPDRKLELAAEPVCRGVEVDHDHGQVHRVLALAPDLGHRGELPGQDVLHSLDIAEVRPRPVNLPDPGKVDINIVIDVSEQVTILVTNTVDVFQTIVVVHKNHSQEKSQYQQFYSVELKISYLHVVITSFSQP